MLANKDITYCPNKDVREALFIELESIGYKIYEDTRKHTSISSYPSVVLSKDTITGSCVERSKTSHNWLSNEEFLAKAREDNPKCPLKDVEVKSLITQLNELL